MKAWLLAGCVLGALLCACNEQQPPAQPGSFDRATRVAFACFDMSDPEIPRVSALDKCDLSTPEIVSGGIITHALHAFVVQSSRGEVAAVDLLNRQTLDSRRDIPGYTFLPVGELPTAIVVPTKDARHAAFTYVANAGSRDITVLKTQAFRELGAKESPTVQTLPLPGGSRDAPYDMVLSPEEDALFVSIPDTGRVLRVPIQRCSGSNGAPTPADAGEPMSDPAQPCAEGELAADGITEIPIGDSVARSAMDTSPDVPAERYLKACDFKAPVSNASLPLPELPADIADTQPKPSGMSVDSFCLKGEDCRRRLLIADQALPLIHVVDLDAVRTGGAEVIQVPIRTGVPTKSVVVTPRVPVDTSPESAETQYVYAIDATDGSVLVTENGRLLHVGSDGARPDRVSLGGGQTLPVAVSLSVMTPAFKVDQPANEQNAVESPGTTLKDPSNTINYCIDTLHPIRSNLRLRGVFVAVGVSDGSVRVIDLHDVDLAECRSCQKYDPDCDPDKCGNGTNRCDACVVQNWDPYPLVRHRTRIVTTADRTADTPPIAPIAQPAFVSGNVGVTVRPTGTTSDPLIKGLACVRCGEGQTLAFPNEAALGTQVDTEEPASGDSDTDSSDTDPCAAGEARVCAQNDPWAELDDWTAVYQGVIPGSRGGEGVLAETDGRVELQQAEGRFCELGVLGGDDLPQKTGDRVNVIGPLATDSAIENAEPHARNSSAAVARSFEAEVLAACKKLVADRDKADAAVPIAFTIQQAFDDRLVLSPNLVNRPSGLGSEFEDDWQFVNKCFGAMPLTYQVRAGAGWVVLGQDTAGFVHRVRAEEGTGHCVQDPAQDLRRNGRAYENEPFDNGFVTFQILAAGSTPPKLDTQLLLRLAATTVKATLNASITVNSQVVASIPVDLEWSQADNTLYMVDIATRGLIEIPVDPWGSGVSRSFQ